MNPNSGTAPVFRKRRDADLITTIYDRLPILVNHASSTASSNWPVKYVRMFDMTNASDKFRTLSDLENEEKAWPVGGNRFNSPNGLWLPLYEGKSIQLFNHRYANIRINPKNISGQGVTEPLTSSELRDHAIFPEPRYWVKNTDIPEYGMTWVVGFNSICNTNNARSLITAIVPAVGFGNSLPIFYPSDPNKVSRIELLAANFGSVICDYVARQKIQSRNLNKYIIEQLPVVPKEAYESTYFGNKSAADIVRELILELTYTAHDMDSFARDMGHVDDEGKVLPPFQWDEERRVDLRAKLDATYFCLYGVTDRDDIRYIYSTFPITEREERKVWGKYRSCELCLAWINALMAGDSDANVHI